MNHKGHNVTQSFVEHDAVSDEVNCLSKEILDTGFMIHTYLKLSVCSLGLLINFNVPSLKNGIKRVIMTDKKKNNFV